MCLLKMTNVRSQRKFLPGRNSSLIIGKKQNLKMVWAMKHDLITVKISLDYKLFRFIWHYIINDTSAWIHFWWSEIILKNSLKKKTLDDWDYSFQISPSSILLLCWLCLQGCVVVVVVVGGAVGNVAWKDVPREIKSKKNR